MKTNIDKYKEDLEILIKKGDNLHHAMQKKAWPNQYEEKVRPLKGENYESFIKKLPSFPHEYQGWYSEALILIKQLLPDREIDFRKLYEQPKRKRQSISRENYTIEDCLHGVSIPLGGGDYGGFEVAIPKFRQQLSILNSVNKRFESTLFDIRQLVQADLFDSELDIAEELIKKGFVRAAGAIAGVVLEGHLSQVCKDHNIKIIKANPTISFYNDELKRNEVYEVSVFRNIQLLGDLRNKCGHKKESDPKKEEIQDLIKGVNKIIKTVF